MGRMVTSAGIRLALTLTFLVLDLHGGQTATADVTLRLALADGGLLPESFGGLMLNQCPNLHSHPFMSLTYRLLSRRSLRLNLLLYLCPRREFCEVPPMLSYLTRTLSHYNSHYIGFLAAGLPLTTMALVGTYRHQSNPGNQTVIRLCDRYNKSVIRRTR